MKGIICSICMKSDILCSACQRNVDEMKITPLTLDVIRFLGSIQDRHKRLKDAKVVRTLGNRGNLVIVAERGSGGKIVGLKGSIIKELSRKFGRVRVVEDGDTEQILSNLVFPVVPISVNKAYTADREFYKVRIRSSDKRRLTISISEFSELTKSLGIEADIFFE